MKWIARFIYLYSSIKVSRFVITDYVWLFSYFEGHHLSINEFVNFKLELVIWIIIQFCKFVFIVEDGLLFRLWIRFIKFDMDIGFICFFIVMSGFFMQLFGRIFSCWMRMVESLSSSFRATCTDIPDPLSPLLPIVHRLWQVFRATSRILT